MYVAEAAPAFAPARGASARPRSARARLRLRRPGSGPRRRRPYASSEARRRRSAPARAARSPRPAGAAASPPLGAYAFERGLRRSRRARCRVEGGGVEASRGRRVGATSSRSESACGENGTCGSSMARRPVLEGDEARSGGVHRRTRPQRPIRGPGRRQSYSIRPRRTRGTRSASPSGRRSNVGELEGHVARPVRSPDLGAARRLLAALVRGPPYRTRTWWRAPCSAGAARARARLIVGRVRATAAASRRPYRLELEGGLQIGVLDDVDGRSVARDAVLEDAKRRCLGARRSRRAASDGERGPIGGAWINSSASLSRADASPAT